MVELHCIAFGWQKVIGWGGGGDKNVLYVPMSALRSLPQIPLLYIVYDLIAENGCRWFILFAYLASYGVQH